VAKARHYPSYHINVVQQFGVQVQPTKVEQFLRYLTRWYYPCPLREQRFHMRPYQSRRAKAPANSTMQIISQPLGCAAKVESFA
jgi:hypothetical protein